MLRDKNSQALWAPIIKKGDEERDERSCIEGSARYTSRNKRLMDNMEALGNVWIACWSATQDVWCGWLVCTLNLDRDGTYSYWISSTGGRYLLSGGLGGVTTRVPHNDISAQRGSSRE